MSQQIMATCMSSNNCHSFLCIGKLAIVPVLHYTGDPGKVLSTGIMD